MMFTQISYTKLGFSKQIIQTTGYGSKLGTPEWLILNIDIPICGSVSHQFLLQRTREQITSFTIYIYIVLNRIIQQISFTNYQVEFFKRNHPNNSLGVYLNRVDII